MTDTRNAAQLRDMLRIQFEEAAGIASDPATSALFAKLAATTNDIPAATLDAYSELFEDFTGSEIEREMMGSVGVSGGRSRRVALSKNSFRYQPGIGQQTGNGPSLPGEE
jgi:hypothetical protein